MSEVKKAATIFDHLSNITDKKVSWESLSEVDKKSFTPYMINRWLSMNPSFIEFINEFQRYTIGQLDAKDTYKLYLDILPKQKQFSKYIKGKKEDKYNSELIDIISKHFLISRSDSAEYIDMMYKTNLNTIKEILKKYAKTDKDITKLLK